MNCYLALSGHIYSIVVPPTMLRLGGEKLLLSSELLVPLPIGLPRQVEDSELVPFSRGLHESSLDVSRMGFARCRGQELNLHCSMGSAIAIHTKSQHVLQYQYIRVNTALSSDYTKRLAKNVRKHGFSDLLLGNWSGVGLLSRLFYGVL